MRRQDREITDPRKIDEIILACDCCRLGFADENGVYIVPLNFGYASADGKRSFYFHGAKEGRKIDLINQTGRAGFELDTKHEVTGGETACDYSFRYQSVIGQGTVSLLTDAEEKKAALQLIMAHYSDKSDWAFPDTAVRAVAVFQLKVSELACKEHL
ncbi:pyridoxamine 5'-phosphate oxidase family protein [Caproiciproducens faecalis]|uniref:Pyridoxamine 5'-phosphate oxidase family protein n=1 Tax=Caproiciproducens faecalis TaxID=2820301 RepID=A0ABS7DJ28_9FIRM|nr:pyridoxamine 5'-phosphate oxidase family protein [Caproiciproducens faecalis]MBW7571299.1 pyridoxamine 5'-phosphate oxidase family protein [Caproiciproducens faecalis]